MDSHDCRLIQTQLGENLFQVTYAGRVFLVRPFPLKVLEIDRVVATQDDLDQETLASLDGTEATPSQPSYAGFAAVEFITTTHCNLRCTHCTARAFDAEDAAHEYYGMSAEHMPLDLMCASIDASIEQLARRLAIHPVRVPAFEMFITGGEPLLAWPALKTALVHAHERLKALPGTDGYSFTPHIVTNGILITDEMAHEMRNLGTHVTVALDSPYNQVRVDNRGEPATPDAIVGLKRLIAAGHRNASVNVVIAGEDMDKVDRVLGYLEGLGAFEGITTIQLSPLAPPIAHTAFAEKGLSRRNSGFSSEGVCDAFSEKLIEYSRRYNIDMKGYGAKLGGWMMQGGTQYRCPVAEWKWVVTPAGDVYACHQLVGIEQFKMGNIQEPDWYDAPQARAVRDRFLARTIDAADSCSACVLKSTCMVFVDCPARSFLEMGHENKVVQHYCQCGKTYLEKLFGEHLLALFETGKPAVMPIWEER